MPIPPGAPVAPHDKSEKAEPEMGTKSEKAKTAEAEKSAHGAVCRGLRVNAVCHSVTSYLSLVPAGSVAVKRNLLGRLTEGVMEGAPP